MHPGRGQKGLHMHAVGDALDGVFMRRDLGPESGLHPRSGLGVGAAHTVMKTRTAERERGLIKIAPMIGADPKA
ncbi:MAG: hypothetical protein USCGTAYLOR_03030 [Chromatiales bacterium USCg_Taylor]|nr:MAG: hypothetical protein USCGTAYLOR_03030 [Chromatiales bacterium USCg_Taylor]